MKKRRGKLLFGPVSGYGEELSSLTCAGLNECFLQVGQFNMKN